jgi:hypothetical protein
MSLLTLLQTQAAGEIDGTAEWVQAPATWQAADVPVIDATATFEQAAATWDATAASVEAPSGTTGGAFIAGRAYTRERQPRIIAFDASFAQRPATWHAEMATSDDELLMELLEMAA